MRRTIFIVLVGVLVIFSVAATGCGGDAGVTTTQSTVGQSTPSTGGSAGDAPDPGGGEGCVLSGEELAKALDAEFVSVTPMAPSESQTRCVYEVIDAAGEPQAFVMWTFPPEDFPLLKEVEDDRTGDLAGLGDDAFIAYHPDDERYDVYAVLDGTITVEVTGSDEESVKKVAALALTKY